MFERFTDRARRALTYAQQEARLLNHNFIGTEHLLLGLLHEGDGVANVLETLGITLESVRERVADTIDPSGSATTGSPPFTPRAKRVLELSSREALQLGHDYISSEHMLLGLIQEGQGVGVHVLASSGVDLSMVRQRVIELLARHRPAGARATVTESGSRAGVGPTVPPSRSRRFPDELLDPVRIDDIAETARVDLIYRNSELLEGTVGGDPVRLHLDIPSHAGTATGGFGGAEVAATWHLDDNTTTYPEPTGTLTGRFAGQPISLNGWFRLHPGFFFERGGIEGEVNGERLRVEVTGAEGGLDSTNTVAADGAIGVTSFELFAAVAGDLTRSVVRGSLGGRPVLLDAYKDGPSPTVRIIGTYQGLPELLGVVVGAMLYFL